MVGYNYSHHIGSYRKGMSRNQLTLNCGTKRVREREVGVDGFEPPTLCL